MLVICGAEVDALVDDSRRWVLLQGISRQNRSILSLRLPVQAHGAHQSTLAMHLSTGLKRRRLHQSGEGLLGVVCFESGL